MSTPADKTVARLCELLARVSRMEIMTPWVYAMDVS